MPLHNHDLEMGQIELQKALREKYQVDRAKKYLKDNASSNGSEPKLEYCIIQDLVKMIEKR